MNLTAHLRTDRAENSIMQTITIAVSAILIAAGLVTAPGLINNARDNNARTDLANLAYAQEMYAAGYDGEINFLSGNTPETLAAMLPGATAEPLTWASGEGRYALTIEELLDAGLAVSLSGGVEHAMTVSPDGRQYLMAAQSESGNVFYRSSGSGVTSSDISVIETHGLTLPVPSAALDDSGGGTPPPAPTYLSMTAELATSGIPGIVLTVDPSAFILSSSPAPVVHACATETRCQNPVETVSDQFSVSGNQIRVELGEIEASSTVFFWVEGVLVGPVRETAERFDTELVEFTRDGITITNGQFTGAGDVQFDFSYYRHDDAYLEFRVCNTSATTGCVNVWTSAFNSDPEGVQLSRSLTTPSYLRSQITGNPVWVRVTVVTAFHTYSETVQISR
jgi:hypothetical protein